MNEPKLLLDYYKLKGDCEFLKQEISDKEPFWSRDQIRVQNKRLKEMQGDKKRLKAKLSYLNITIPNLQDSK